MEENQQHKRVLLLGEFGAFGRFLAARLARLPSIELALGSPAPGQLTVLANECGARVVPIDPADPTSLARACREQFAVVNTGGPFLGQDYRVAEAALAAGAHYIDPADVREYVAGFESLDRRAQSGGCLLVTGAAPSPALAAALVEMALPDFDRVTGIETFLAPGNQDRRELATARAIVGFLDRTIRIKEQGQWRQAPGWRRPRSVDFPPPVGRRRGYLCDTADLDLFPRYFGAQTVRARAGIRSVAFNRGVSLLALLRRHRMIDRVPPWAQRHLRSVVRVAPGLPGAGLRVEVRGPVHGVEQVHVLILFTRQGNGHALAAAPILALMRTWAERGVPARGARACLGLLTWESLRAELLEGDDVALIRSWESS